MTKKIFLEDVLQRSSEAVVTDCVELKTGFGIVLDQTVFYPEGGGQLSDTGKLICGDREVVVTHVRETEGRNISIVGNFSCERQAPGSLAGREARIAAMQLQEMMQRLYPDP